jgi:opacity protein-like surface antigen
MRALTIVATISVLTAAPLYAQTERAYVTGVGGFAATPDTTSGDVLGEVGVRVAPHLLVFGDLGQFHNLQPSDLQPAVDNATALLADTQGVTVLSTARVPAWYSLGGVRYELPIQHRLSPYVLGGIGFARLTPTAQFTYSSGTPADGSTPVFGEDLTNQLVSSGLYTAPSATTAFMFTLGGGLEIPVTDHWAVDAGYRFSRVSAATPLNAQGPTFGLGYRF